MTIRPEASSDISAIHALVAAAFGRPDEADLVDRLRADGDSVISLVAAEGNDLLGHVLFSRMTAPFKALSLAPVSVAPARQRQGIGSRLIWAGLDAARTSGWNAVFVLGEPDYYRRFGFDPALASGFSSPYAGPYLMALALGGDLPVRHGPIAHADAFRFLD
jgi:putative acetyltransferase